MADGDGSDFSRARGGPLHRLRRYRHAARAERGLGTRDANMAAQIRSCMERNGLGRRASTQRDARLLEMRLSVRRRSTEILALRGSFHHARAAARLPAGRRAMRAGPEQRRQAAVSPMLAPRWGLRDPAAFAAPSARDGTAPRPHRPSGSLSASLSVDAHPSLLTASHGNSHRDRACAEELDDRSPTPQAPPHAVQIRASPLDARAYTHTLHPLRRRPRLRLLSSRATSAECVNRPAAPTGISVPPSAGDPPPGEATVGPSPGSGERAAAACMWTAARSHVGTAVDCVNGYERGAHRRGRPPRPRRNPTGSSGRHLSGSGCRCRGRASPSLRVRW